MLRGVRWQRGRVGQSGGEQWVGVESGSETGKARLQNCQVGDTVYWVTLEDTVYCAYTRYQARDDS